MPPRPLLRAENKGLCSRASELWLGRILFASSEGKSGLPTWPPNPANDANPACFFLWRRPSVFDHELRPQLQLFPKLPRLIHAPDTKHKEGRKSQSEGYGNVYDFSDRWQ